MAPKSLTIKELLRQHAGRFIESNTICLLYNGCIKASSDSGVNVGLVIGEEYSTSDAAIVVDPGEDFPRENLIQTYAWAQRANILTMCLDCKSSFFANQCSHFTSILVGQLPEYPDHVVLVPFQAIRSMDYNHPDPRTTLSLLAPYTFSKDCLADQIGQLVKSIRHHSTSYKNTHLGIDFKGWRPVLHNGTPTLESTSYPHRQAEENIERLVPHLKPSFELRRNPVQPYIGDRILVDMQTGAQYVLEFKVVSKWNSGCSSSLNETNMWHFMTLCKDDQLFIIRRDPEPGSIPKFNERIDSIPAKKHSMSIDFGKEGALEEFASFIREHGMEATRLVREQDKTAIYHFTTTQPTLLPLDNTTITESSSDASGFDFVENFCNPLNTLCRRVEMLFCWYLGPYNPIGDALIFNKSSWTQEELKNFDATTNHPFPLQSRDVKCIPIVHLDVNKINKKKLRNMKTGKDSSIHKISRSDQPRPACGKQGWVYVLGHHPTEEPGNMISIVQSKELGVQCELDCTICDDPVTIQWRGGRRGVVDKAQIKANSTSFRPFLLEHRNEESLNLHAYFMEMFDKDDPRYVRSLSDMLQTQLNHGPCCVRERPSFSTLFFRRNIFEPRDGSFPLEAEEVDSTHSSLEDTGIASNATDNSAISERKRVQLQLLERLDSDSGYSATAEESFAYKGLMCDACSDPKQCRIYDDGKQPARHPSAICRACVANCAHNPGIGSRCFWDKQEQAAQELAQIPQYRRWIPCNNCWNNKWVCNKEDQCQNCVAQQRLCIREQCELYNENGEDCFIQNCQKAHNTDGYRNTVSQQDMPQLDKRSTCGGDGRSYISRIPVCVHCWAQGWDALCDNDGPCLMCSITTPGVFPNAQEPCTRRLCKFLECQSRTCNRVHDIDHGFLEIGDFPASTVSVRKDTLKCPDLTSDQLKAIASSQLRSARAGIAFLPYQIQKVAHAYVAVKAAESDELRGITDDEMRIMLGEENKKKVTKADLTKFLKARQVKIKAGANVIAMKAEATQYLNNTAVESSQNVEEKTDSDMMEYEH